MFQHQGVSFSIFLLLLFYCFHFCSLHNSKFVKKGFLNTALKEYKPKDPPKEADHADTRNLLKESIT